MKPTAGRFEKAYIDHGDIVKDGRYEYMAIVDADPERVGMYMEKLPYSVVRCDSSAHIVADNESGTKGFAVFSGISEGDDGIIAEISPSLVMYSLDDGKMTLSVSNPDLALYSGPSDEIFDENGKRTERSIYGRKWVNNHCGATSVSMTLNGKWEIADSGDSDVTAEYENGRTHLVFRTGEARTEEIILKEIK